MPTHRVMAPSHPLDETRRLHTLARYGIVDTPADPAFDRITRLTQRLLGVPIVLITFVEEDRQWFKASCGLDMYETPRDVSFCAHAIQRQDVMVVEDAVADPRFAENPLVTGEPGIRFYAGAPLIAPDNARLGTLCVIDREPRTLTDEQEELLTDLASMVMDELELRREIEARRQAQAALKRSEAKFRSLVEQTNDWIWEVDRDARFMYASPGVVNLIGYAADDVAGRTFYSFMTEPAARQFEAMLRTYVTRRAPFVMQRTTLRHRSGGEVIAEVSGAPVFDENGAVAGYQGIAHDVTAHLMAEEALSLALTRAREVNELKSHFVSMVSHEFRTPLTAMQLSTELLQRFAERGDLERARKHAQSIENSVKRLQDLADNVLVLSRNEAGKLPFEPEPIDAKALLQATVEEIQAGIGAEHTLRVDAADPLPPLRSDRRLLRLIVTNLLSNAVKYSPEQTTIDCRLYTRPGEIVLEVQDRGIGIPVEDLPQLFEAYHRAGNAGMVRGTGLGLAIVKQATDLCGGHIAVDSTPDVGSTFRLRLPVETD